MDQGHVFGYVVPSRDFPLLVVLPEIPQIISGTRLRRCGVVQVQLYDELDELDELELDDEDTIMHGVRR